MGFLRLIRYMGRHFGKSRDYYERTRYVMQARDFIINGRDII